MGEHKLPKTTPKPPKRPGADILGLKSSIAGWESGVMGVSDPDTNDFMKALRNVLAWVEELETATDPFAKVVPLISPELPDDHMVILDRIVPWEIGPDPRPSLTVGEFRRLNPMAVEAAAKPTLNS